MAQALVSSPLSRNNNLCVIITRTIYLKGHLLFVNQFHNNVVGGVEGKIGTEDVEEVGGDGRLAYCTPQEKCHI